MFAGKALTLLKPWNRMDSIRACARACGTIRPSYLGGQIPDRSHYTRHPLIPFPQPQSHISWSKHSFVQGRRLRIMASVGQGRCGAKRKRFIETLEVGITSQYEFLPSSNKHIRCFFSTRTRLYEYGHHAFALRYVFQSVCLLPKTTKALLRGDPCCRKVYP